MRLWRVLEEVVRHVDRQALKLRQGVLSRPTYKEVVLIGMAYVAAIFSEKIEQVLKGAANRRLSNSVWVRESRERHPFGSKWCE